MEIPGFPLPFRSVKRGKYVRGKNFVQHELLTINKAVMHTWEHSWIWISGCVLCPELDWDAQHIFLILGNPLGALQTAEPNFRVLGGPGEANLSILLLVPRLFSRCTFLECSELWQDLSQGRYLWGTAEQHLSPSVRFGLKCLS